MQISFNSSHYAPSWRVHGSYIHGNKVFWYILWRYHVLIRYINNMVFRSKHGVFILIFVLHKELVDRKVFK